MFRNTKKQGAVLKELIKVISPQQMLDEKHLVTVQNIQNICALDEKRFTILCLDLMRNLVAFCQLLPHSTLFYEQSIVGHSLKRTESALVLFEKFLIKKDDEELSEDQKLWQYALLSAGILQGLGKLHCDFKIDLFNEKAKWTKIWNPLAESIFANAKYYVYKYLPEAEASLRTSLNILMAKMIMPREGFEWIASNRTVFTVWLALLHEDFIGAGTLGAVLKRADALALRHLLKLTLGHDGNKRKPGAFLEPVNPTIDQKELQLGLQFLDWLHQALENGQLTLNKNEIFLVSEGMLLCKEVFQAFLRDNPSIKNWEAVQQAFLALGIHYATPEGGIVSHYEITQDQKRRSGVVFALFGMVTPDVVKFFNALSGRTSDISALDLTQKMQNNMHLQKKVAEPLSLPSLNSQGKWQANNPPEIRHLSTTTYPMKPGSF